MPVTVLSPSLLHGTPRLLNGLFAQLVVPLNATLSHTLLTAVDEAKLLAAAGFLFLSRVAVG